MPPLDGEKPRRSRTGCQNCRRLHRKCDETKPACLGCLASGKQCNYSLRVSWGGRPFTKSSFGKCLKTDVAVVPTAECSDAGQSRSNSEENEDTSFIYGLVKSRSRVEVIETESQSSSNLSRLSSPVLSSPANSIRAEAYATSISQNPSHLSHLRPSHRLLLDHFCNAVTRSFSLHLSTHHGFCMTYLPLALDPATGNGLLPAVLEAAALHRKSLGLYHDERELIALRHASVRRFKLPTIGKNPVDDDKALATALILCLCDILAGGEKANSWQLHLQGAIAMIQQASKVDDTSQESDLRRFLRRWCESLEVLSIIGPDSKLAGQTVEKTSNLDYIDEFHGFCRRLIPIFQEIHLLLMECQSLQETLELVGPSHPTVERMSYVVEERCRAAVNSVKSSLAQTSYTFHPSIQSYMSPQIQSEFVSLNLAFHHGILLHIYRRVQGLPPTDSDIEASVEAIILHLSELYLRDEACPGVAMLQPLFDAGCASYSLHHRDRVIELMNTLEKRYGMGNVSRARAFLQEYWMEFDQQRVHGVDLHWDTYIKLKGWELSLY